MTALCQLDVRGNHLEGVLPHEVSRMKAKANQVCDVRLSGNEPGFSLPEELDALGDEIVELDLSYCSLHGFLPRTLPKSLRRIVLDGNRFSGEIPVSWSHIESLERLSKVDCGIPDSSGCKLRCQIMLLWLCCNAAAVDSCVRRRRSSKKMARSSSD